MREGGLRKRYGWPHSDAPKHVIEFSNFHLQCTDALVRIPFHASYPADIKSLKSATANISKGREGHRARATTAGAAAATATAPAEPVEALAAPVAALAAPATLTDQYLHFDEVNDDKVICVFSNRDNKNNTKSMTMKGGFSTSGKSITIGL
ncbi:hypothetical protein HZH66_007569 [Vespula vulgaris]|uniref:Uncharacterized protein n=1 Tax=Vespula vulgaris TaxID=7454 RepID=A0A834N577_VESVU|nr:hypothetical protein HZH66_007569 [Vespula vulgaris]